MSFEQVLLVLTVLALPLLESVLRAARKRSGDQSPPTGSVPAPGHERPVRPVQPLPAPASDVISRPERDPARDAHVRVPQTTVRSPRPGAVVQALQRPPDLRRAIVLMAVLEPCRAAQPHD